MSVPGGVAGPLSGTRAVDLTRVLAGPFCSMLLADMGCDVIKVERPGGGDETRAWGPPFRGGQSLYFLSVNRNKRSVALDLKSDAGRAALERLAASSDILIENFLPGTMERMGLGYARLREVNPRLVYCSISGFGADGPRARTPGYDVTVAGMFGLLSITGEADGPPCKPGVALTDICTGLTAQSGILSALLQRERTGEGQKVETSLMEVQLASLVNIASNALNTPPQEWSPKRWGTAHESIVPYQAFVCSCGGHVLVGANSDDGFRKLAVEMGLEELATDPKFSSNAKRVERRVELIGTLDRRFREKTVGEWVGLIEPLGIPVGPVRSVREAFDDEQALHREIVQVVQHPTAGLLNLPGNPLTFGGLRPGVRRPPPLLGQHTEEVLVGVGGYTEAEARALAQGEDA